MRATSSLRTGVLWCALLVLLTHARVHDARAQTADTPVRLEIAVGFAGYFEPDRWLPVRAQLENDGEDVTGRLVVRPETSGAGIPNTFSTPVTLAAGGRQAVTFAISARAFATNVRVELLDDSGIVLASTNAPVRAARPNDRLYAVLTASAAGGLDLTASHPGGGEAHQVDWAISELPDQAAALAPLDLIAFSDIDTGDLAPTQQRALADWIIGGGQLVVAGGANWAATAAGLRDLLPFTPSTAQTTDTLAPLADWLRLGDDARTALDGTTPLAVGTVNTDAQVLVASSDGTPLLVRRLYGAGVVDYLAADLSAQPLRSWAGLPDLWTALQTTRPPAPSWTRGIRDFEIAAGASELLPGFDPLPDAGLLLGFLGLYILLIGPVNYLVLWRLNRREWAWFTIPLTILVFTVAAYVIGSQIRGSDVTFNRLALVRVYSNAARAPAEGILGLLSPRRRAYTLSVEPGSTLRPAPRDAATSALLARDSSAVQSSIEIAQAARYAAADFSVDSSFIAPFDIEAMLEPPAVGGSATLAYDLESGVAGQMTVRGSVANNTDAPIRDGVILARGVAEQVGTLEPGAILPFSLTLTGEGQAAPLPYVPSPSFGLSGLQAVNDGSERSVADILGPDGYDDGRFTFALNLTPEITALLRRQLFLAAFVDDSYGGTGRGDAVYFVGWTDAAPLGFTLDDAAWNAQAETAVIAQLETAVTTPAASVTITGDRMTWMLTTFEGIGDVSPVALILQPGERAAFRFTPLPTAVLSEVESVRVAFDDLSSSNRTIPVELWQWATGEWVEVEIAGGDARIPDPARFLGVHNALELRIAADGAGGYLRIGRVRVEMTGR